MKTKKEELNLGSFAKNDKIIIFRLKNGNIAAEDPDNVLIKLEKTDKIQLNTLTVEETRVSFFKINDNKINAVFAESSISLPKTAKFTDIYTTSHYDGVYCKYATSKGEGIIYISETEISEVISHTSGYEDIWFENETFFAKKVNKGKYYAINQAGHMIMEKDFEFKKVKDFELFYSNNKFFTQESEAEVPEKIKNIEVMDVAYYVNNCENFPKAPDMTLNVNFDELLPAKVKVQTSKGIYFYNRFFEYLVGPLNQPKIISIYQVYGLPCIIENSKIKSDYYIFEEDYPTKTIYNIDNNFAISKITSQEGFFIRNGYIDFYNARKAIYFFEDRESKNVYAPNLKLIGNIGKKGYIDDIWVDRYGDSYDSWTLSRRKISANKCTLELYDYKKQLLHSCICSNDEIRILSYTQEK